MNDLMTKSFLSYVDLKKQAMKDLQTGPDIETGRLDPSDEETLSKFFQEVAAVKAHMEEINYLLTDLQDLNEETKSAKSPKILRGLRDRINSDMIMVLRKAKIIKTRLETLDNSNVANRSSQEERAHIDRTRISVTNGLRIKLKGMMNDFQTLRLKIVDDHKEGLKTGQGPIEGMVSGNGPVRVLEEKGDFQTMRLKIVDDHKEGLKTGERTMVSGNGPVRVLEENGLRDEEGVREVERSLVELHKVFLDMAVMVEVQGEKMNDIEENVVRAGFHVKGAAKELDRAERLKKRRRRRVWGCWIGIVVMVLLVVCLIAILF